MSDDDQNIIRDMISALGSKIDLTHKTVELIDARTGVTQTEVQRLNHRMTLAEGEIRNLKDRDSEIVRSTSETDLKQQSDLGAAIVHVRGLEAEIRSIKTTVNANAVETERQTPMIEQLAKSQLLKQIAIAIGAGVAAYFGARGH